MSNATMSRTIYLVICISLVIFSTQQALAVNDQTDDERSTSFHKMGIDQGETKLTEQGMFNIFAEKYLIC